MPAPRFIEVEGEEFVLDPPRQVITPMDDQTIPYYFELVGYHTTGVPVYLGADHNHYCMFDEGVVLINGVWCETCYLTRLDHRLSQLSERERSELKRKFFYALGDLYKAGHHDLANTLGDAMRDAWGR